MNQIPSACPICGGGIQVTRFTCHECNSTIEGRFEIAPFTRLSPEHLSFIGTFIRCEGKLNRMESELNLSYPTIRNRLQEVIRALGYEPSSNEDAEPVYSEQRHSILKALENGEINADQAINLLQEGSLA